MCSNAYGNLWVMCMAKYEPTRAPADAHQALTLNRRGNATRFTAYRQKIVPVGMREAATRSRNKPDSGSTGTVMYAMNRLYIGIEQAVSSDETRIATCITAKV